MPKSNILWAVVTADEFELPIMVEDTAQALANKLGISISGVFKRFERDNIQGQRSGYKIIRIRV